MRVALIGSHSFDYCIEYAELVAQSCEVLFFVDRKRLASRKSWNAKLTIAASDWPRHRELRNLSFVLGLRRRIKAFKPDIIHFLGENNIWLNFLPPLLRPLPIVTTVHDIGYHPGDVQSQRVPRVFINLFIRQSDYVVVHGKELREMAAERLPVAANRLFIFLHPPLLHYKRLAEKLAGTSKEDGIFRILFFGRIFEYKGLKYLLEAAPAILDRLPSARFVVAGSDDLNIVGDIDPSLKDKFDLRTRFIPDEEAALLFNQADVIALPYIEGSQSGILMMALALERPVVATDVGAIGALVRRLQIGMVVPPADPAALATALVEMGKSGGLRRRFALNAAAALIGEFSVPVLSSRAKSMYETMAEQKKK